LTALKLQLAAAQDAAATEAPALSARISETALMVDDLVKSVRRIATELRPAILDQLGLPAAVEWLAQDFSRRTGIRCQSTILPINGAISDELATALFRIVQEALTNVSRHAGATRVNIELGVKSDCVTLEVNDDGGGITEAGTAAEAVALAFGEGWDVVLLDLGLPDRNGLEVLKELPAARPHLPVLVLTMFPEDQFGLRMLKMGASGYPTKNQPPKSCSAR